MQFASALGYGAVAAAIGLGLWAVGATTGRPRLARVGLIAILAVGVSGALTDLLKLFFELPRPSPWHSAYGFPSGHTTIAFALAAVLGHAAPSAAPFLYLLAVLTGVARLYLQAHFTIDTIGGAVVGIVVGLVLARGLVPPAGPERDRSAPAWAWALPAVTGLLAIGFFWSYEGRLVTQRAPETWRTLAPAAAVVAFGTPEGRAALVSGWSGDERWKGAVPFVWAEGAEAALRLPALPPAPHRLRLRLLPYLSRNGLSCQRLELSVNGAPAGRLLLDRGWNDYDVLLPKALIRPSANDVGFRFAYAGGRGHVEPRPLSVAFASLEAWTDPRYRISPRP